MTEENQAVQEEKEMTVEVDGVQYAVSDLSAEVQDMLKMHQAWNMDLAKASDKVNQVRAAVQQISNQIVESIRADAVAAEQAVADEAPTAATGTPAV